MNVNPPLDQFHLTQDAGPPSESVVNETSLVISDMAQGVADREETFEESAAGSLVTVGFETGLRKQRGSYML